MADVQGTVAPGFEAVRTVFEQQFDKGEHVGSSVAIYHRGRPVVDLWGGTTAKDGGRAWEHDTMSIVYSVSKGLTATCVHVLADRGLIDYEAPVAKYWPEYAQNGKESTTVRQLMSHQAGVPQLPEGTDARDLLDWDKMIHGIEQLTPAWMPGEATGYHALNFGWLAGELVRRVDGRSLGRFLRDEVSKPLGITQMYIGAPPEVEPEIAKLESMIVVTPEMEKQRETLGATLTGRASAPASGDLQAVLDSPEGHASEIPAVSAVTSAEALARLYACLGNYGELDGVPIISEATMRKATERLTNRPDKVLVIPVGWSMGYMTGAPGWPQGPNPTGFGHAGFGGSLGFAYPELGMAFGFVANAITSDILGYVRAGGLASAARAVIEATEAAA